MVTVIVLVTIEGLMTGKSRRNRAERARSVRRGMLIVMIQIPA